MTDAFAVSTPALREFAARLDELAEGCASNGVAYSYAHEYISLNVIDTAFLFAKAIWETDDVREAIIGGLIETNRVLRACSQELRTSADQYDIIDDAADARLDALYPTDLYGGVTPVPRWSESVYTWPTPPADALTPPTWVPQRNLVEEILDADWFSPTGLVNDLIDWIFDYDPIGEVSKAFSGNWQALYECGDAVAKMGEFHTCVGSHVGAGTSILRDYWSGLAGDAAATYFTNLGTQMQANANSLAPVVDAYEQVAMGMESASSIVSGLMARAMDWMIASATLYTAAGILAETIVGGIVGFLLGTGALGYGIWLASEAYKAIQDTWEVVDVLVMVTSALSTVGMGSGATLGLPAGYDNRIVP